MTAPDQFNTALNVNWNRTYGPFEPQQIHLSLATDSQYARFEFLTTSPIDKAILRYWPKSDYSAVTRATTTLEGDSWVYVDGGEERRVRHMHLIKSETLEKATVYQYQVGTVAEGCTIWGPELEFHTQGRGDAFSYLAIGDLGVNNAVSLPHLVNLAHTHQYDFITVSGDQAYDMTDFNGTKGDQYMNMVQSLFARVPYLGVPGNHERLYNFSDYKNRQVHRCPCAFASLPFRESHFDSSITYSFDYGNLHLIAFSTETYFFGSEDEIRAGIHWLEADLKQINQNRHERPWIVLITHHPLYCSFANEDCDINSALLRDGKNGLGAIEPLLLEYKVDVVISGHVHNYERTFPMARGLATSMSYKNPSSTVYIVLGNAGQPEGTSKFNTTGPYPVWSAKRFDGHGYSTVHVTPTSFTMIHHATNMDGTLGGVVDEFTITK
ncbi:Metallo-dependent phosphatase-like protein [Dichotomocladium elegans]|nr:Metallo-dependent phosphatase-like protein [Dichotomocladium elegans]